MQIVPAGVGACFSARDYGRPLAPSVSASIVGSKVNLQLQAAKTSFGFMDVLRAEGNRPLTFLVRLADTTRSFTDTTVLPGRDYRYDRLKNTPAELQQQDAKLRDALIARLANTNLIVTGYSGRDDRPGELLQ